jgi:hypothetical protein
LLIQSISLMDFMRQTLFKDRGQLIDAHLKERNPRETIVVRIVGFNELSALKELKSHCIGKNNSIPRARVNSIYGVYARTPPQPAQPDAVCVSF